MTEVDYAEQLKSLDAVLRNVEVVLDVPRMRKEKAELEAAASEPSLWDDPAHAQQVTSKLSYATAEINRVEKLRARLDDAGVLLELAQGGLTQVMGGAPAQSGQAGAEGGKERSVHRAVYIPPYAHLTTLLQLLSCSRSFPNSKPNTRNSAAAWPK